MKIRTLHSLRDEMRSVARGEKPAPADAASPSFESAEALLRLLNPENRSLLALIDAHRPQSLAELAKLAGRAESNLNRTLAKLQAMGIVQVVQGQGRARIPQLIVRKFNLQIDVRAMRDQIAVE